MNGNSQLAYQALWCVQTVLQCIVIFVLWHRKLYNQVPVFFSYLLWQVVNFAVVFPLYHKGAYNSYFWTYWVGAAISAILGFKTIHEIFLDVFRPYHSLKDLGTIVFRWAGTVMLMVSAVVAFSSSPKYGPLVHAVTTLQRSVRFVQFGLVIFLLLFSRYLGVSRRQYSFGIALGFGAFASVELVVLALNSGGFLHAASVNLIDMIAFNVTTLIWLTYALVWRPVAKEVPANNFQTDRWEESLADLQHPATGDSLIPMFEGMVERALSRTTDGASSAPQNTGRSGSGSSRSVAAAAAASRSRS